MGDGRSAQAEEGGIFIADLNGVGHPEFLGERSPYLSRRWMPLIPHWASETSRWTDDYSAWTSSGTASSWRVSEAASSSASLHQTGLLKFNPI